MATNLNENQIQNDADNGPVTAVWHLLRNGNSSTVIRSPEILQDQVDIELPHGNRVKLSLAYAGHINKKFRRIIEFVLFSFAILCLMSLIYVQMLIPAAPNNCLDNIKQSWPRKGIVRVEVIRSWSEYNEYMDYMKKKKQDVTYFSLKDVFLYGPKSLPEDLKRMSRLYESFKHEDKQKESTWLEDVLEYFFQPIKANSHVEKFTPGKSMVDFLFELETEREEERLASEMNNRSPFIYIVEYALHHGLLRLPNDLRNYYNIPVTLVQLSVTDENQCLYHYRRRSLARIMLGYDDILMSSVKSLAENETEKGYLHDLIKDEHYHFVSFSQSRFIYFTAMFVMLIFTFAISMLLRFSHHQIFLFIVDLLRMFELNQPLVFPIAPLLTVILALVGMEAIMSEIFSDTTTAFYVILLVWCADQYDAICCHSQIGKKHWLRFFYLYHYAFYAYHYRYSGQYTGWALITSSAFVAHSMIFFFHHYELPEILYQEELRNLVQRITRQGNDIQTEQVIPESSVRRALTFNPGTTFIIQRRVANDARRSGITVLPTNAMIAGIGSSVASLRPLIVSAQRTADEIVSVAMTEALADSRILEPLPEHIEEIGAVDHPNSA